MDNDNEEKTSVFCYRCNNQIEEGQEQEAFGDWYCEDCFNDLFFTCTECSLLKSIRVCSYFDEDPYCHPCFQERFPHCDCCSEYYDSSDDNSWGDMCPSCAEEHFICDSCGDTYHNDDYGDDGLCFNCFEDRQPEQIRPYHDAPDLIFHSPPDEATNLYFGVELETDSYSSDERRDAAKELFSLSDNETLFWLEEDSSLSNGIEIITQPCTLNYHLTQFPWSKVIALVKRHGGKSHDTSTCGLHIHFSKAFFGSARSGAKQINLVYLFEKVYAQLSILSRRNQRTLDSQAKPYHNNVYDKPSRQKLHELQAYYYRYQAVNLQNTRTIEIRLFRGSLRLETILASLELVDFLVRLAKKSSAIALQKITWAGMIKKISLAGYLYLPAYIKRFEKELEDNVLDSNKTSRD